MKRRLTQWTLITSTLCLLLVLAVLLFDRTFIGLAEPILKPWFGFCRAVTPEAWQVRGNILLGLGWLFSGLEIYSMLIGAIFVVSAAGMEKLREPEQEAEKSE